MPSIAGCLAICGSNRSSDVNSGAASTAMKSTMLEFKRRSLVVDANRRRAYSRDWIRIGRALAIQ
jgi:hypothetical protein